MNSEKARPCTDSRSAAYPDDPVSVRVSKPSQPDHELPESKLVTSVSLHIGPSTSHVIDMDSVHWLAGIGSMASSSTNLYIHTSCHVVSYQKVKITAT